MQLSFIILNYKSFDYLNICLKSINENVSGIDFEIIIVNNDEQPIGTLDCVNFDCVERIAAQEIVSGKPFKKEGKKIKIIEVNKNIGFGKANNLGALKAEGEIICFLNPDTEIISKNIQQVLAQFEREADLGILGPQVLVNNTKDIQPWSCGVDLTLGEIIFSKLGFSRSRRLWLSEKIEEVDWVSGVCLFIRRRIFLTNGGFDEKFFLYYEDVDLCKRIRQAKKRVSYFPIFKIKHASGGSVNNKYQQKKEYFKAQNYYYKKWFNTLTYRTVQLFNFFYLWRYRF